MAEVTSVLAVENLGDQSEQGYHEIGNLLRVLNEGSHQQETVFLKIQLLLAAQMLNTVSNQSL